MHTILNYNFYCMTINYLYVSDVCIEQVIAELSTKLRIAEERLQATNRGE